jgi:hypothetical protein
LTARTSRSKSLTDADLTDPVEVAAVDSAVTDAEAVVDMAETDVEDTEIDAEVILKDKCLKVLKM